MLKDLQNKCALSDRQSEEWNESMVQISGGRVPNYSTTRRKRSVSIHNIVLPLVYCVN